MVQTAEKVTSWVAQKSFSNKTEETVAQNTPSQDDPFSLGYPHACIPQPQDTKGGVSSGGDCRRGTPSRAAAGAEAAAGAGPRAEVKPDTQPSPPWGWITSLRGQHQDQSIPLIETEIIYTRLQVMCYRYPSRPQDRKYVQLKAETQI